MDSGNDEESWNWEMGDDFFGKTLEIGISSSVWNDGNQNEDDFFHMLDTTTPIKDCSDVDVSFNATEENSSKASQSSEPSQYKRRKMLQFDSDERTSSSFPKSKVVDGSFIEDQVPCENLPWGSNISSSYNGYSTEQDQSSDGWLANCFNDNDMQISLGEMTLSGKSKSHVENPEYCKTHPESGIRPVQDSDSSSLRSRCIFRGRKSLVQSPTKLTTSVVYPFALIKPCGVQGDVTLKDINRRIKAPPPKPKNEENDDQNYPTSAFSGKPVVAKTKIRTEGGSITIMRTKG